MAHQQASKILIVEDDRSTALFQRQRLQQHGHQVFSVSSAEAARKSVSQNQFDLLILDYNLGKKITGLQLYEELKSGGHDVPTILVTGMSDEAVVIEALRAGVRDFVTKSADYLDYLPEAIAKVLHEVSLERRLAESELRLHGIVDSALDAILTVESDLRIGIFNGAAEEIFGCRAQEAIGQPIHHYIPDIPKPGADNGAANWWPQHCRNSSAVERREIAGQRANGEVFPLEASISKVILPAGGIFFTLILRDITETKRAAEALQRAHGDLAARAQELARSNAQLLRSNQELDDFAYVASHDLKEPLRGISNYASFIMEDYAHKLDDEGRSKLQTLQNLSSRLEALINSLLDFSRVARVDMAIQETDLNQTVESVLESLQISLSEREVAVRIPRPLPTVRCDHVRIAEVFRNLITNAMKYSDKKQKWIEIGYSRPETNGVMLDDGGKKSAFVFYVRDNGIGIPAKHLDTVFRIFKRLHGRDRFGGGTGVGLSIVKKIVERHSGRIWIESTVGEGTTFYFTLNQA